MSRPPLLYQEGSKLTKGFSSVEVTKGGECSRLTYVRWSFRITSFRPDQTSLTAHTLMSTKPSGNATSLIVSSVMSVATFDDFFGHETHTKPSCCRPLRRAVSSRFRLSRF